MKKYSILFTLLLICQAGAATALADVRVKSRQTVSGQTYENTTYIKGKRQRTEQNMGGVQTVELTQCDLRRGVRMNPQTKTYLIDPFAEPAGASGGSASPKKPAGGDNVVRVRGGTVTTSVTYKDTGETRKMFGYTARRVITTIETVSSPDACAVGGGKTEIDGWYIDAAFALDCGTEASVGGYTPRQEQGCQDKYELRTSGNAKRGFAVYEKLTVFDASGQETISTVNEVLEFSQATLDAALFDIPGDYREVKNPVEIYTAGGNTTLAAGGPNGIPNGAGYSGDSGGGFADTLRDRTGSGAGAPSADAGTKQPGTVRIGITVKTGATGEGISPADLTAAIRHTLAEYLVGTRIELVPLEAKLPAAIESEAAGKECDYILHVGVSHKKGGGGFGMFSKVIAPAIAQTGIGHTGSTVGNIAGQVATQAVITAASASSNIKAKDELTLEIKLQKGTAAALTKQYKQKAKSNGEDILSPIIEQAAGAIVAAVGS